MRLSYLSPRELSSVRRTESGVAGSWGGWRGDDSLWRCWWWDSWRKAERLLSCLVRGEGKVLGMGGGMLSVIVVGAVGVLAMMVAVEVGRLVWLLLSVVVVES